MRPRLIIFAKAAVAGRVKTRLGRTLGMTVAAHWYRCQMAALLRSVAHDPRWETHLAIAPDTAVGRGPFRQVAARLKRPQGHGDLGDRMQRALLAPPRGPVMIIGSDIPGIRPDHIAQAARLLARNTAVLGPTVDGGYWLIGIDTRRLPPGRPLFASVRWSSEHALSDTVASLASHRIGYAATLRDIDTADDLAAYGRERRNR